LENDVVATLTTEEQDVHAYHMALPIRSRGEVIGVLEVSKLLEAGAWTPVERDQLAGLADQLGQALENARLYEVTQRSALEEQVVGEVTQRMRETLSVDAVLQTAVSELQSLLALESVEIRVGPDGAEEDKGSRSVTDHD
jgi:GAF domain-containing protein